MDAQSKTLRWWIGIHGVLSVAFGVMLLLWPDISLYALTIAFGIYATATGAVGIVSLVTGSLDGEHVGLALLSVVNLAVGIAVLVWPSISAVALLYVIGTWATALGITTVGVAFFVPMPGSDSAGLALVGLVSVVVGVVMFVKPGDGALVLLALIAAYLLVAGISQVIFAVDGKRILEGRKSDALGDATS
jgi:uncharacterized membrane protein HdeD (DUF308 family)